MRLSMEKHAQIAPPRVSAYVNANTQGFIIGFPGLTQSKKCYEVNDVKKSVNNFVCSTSCSLFTAVSYCVPTCLHGMLFLILFVSQRKAHSQNNYNLSERDMVKNGLTRMDIAAYIWADEIALLLFRIIYCVM